MSDKVCPKCNISKPLIEFRMKTEKNGKIYPRWICKNCEKSYQKIKRKQRIKSGNLSERYQIVRQRVKARGYQFLLKKEEWIELISQPCHYCSCSLADIKRGTALDRKDNSKDYTVSNVVPCCYSCNSIKGEHLTHDEMVVAMKAVLNLRSNPNFKKN